MNAPWKYYLAPNGTSALIVEPDDTTVAEIRVLENSTAHRHLEHNIRLMSGAPLMLDALHRISLASQNSMSSKRECGQIARDALLSFIRGSE